MIMKELVKWKLIHLSYANFVFIIIVYCAESELRMRLSVAERGNCMHEFLSHTIYSLWATVA